MFFSRQAAFIAGNLCQVKMGFGISARNVRSSWILSPRHIAPPAGIRSMASWRVNGCVRTVKGCRLLFGKVVRPC